MEKKNLTIHDLTKGMVVKNKTCNAIGLGFTGEPKEIDKHVEYYVIDTMSVRYNSIKYWNASKNKFEHLKLGGFLKMINYGFFKIVTDEQEQEQAKKSYVPTPEKPHKPRWVEI